jgi:dihydroorotate dehydrogenase electron transfer subunit
MAALLHAPYCADQATQRTVTVLENVRLARDTYRVRFGFPELARRITPGQFLMLRLAGGADPLLGRPLALYDAVHDPLAAQESPPPSTAQTSMSSQSPAASQSPVTSQSPVEGQAQTSFPSSASSSPAPNAVDVVYLVKGRMTSRLMHYLPGQTLDVWGPLGNGFPPQETDHLVMVAGGIGQTPFLALAAEHLGLRRYGEPARQVPRVKRVTFCYGARSAGYLAAVEDFERLGVEVKIATDDGSRGRRGFVTELLRETLAEAGTVGSRPRVVCCGPEAMMERAAAIAAEFAAPCQVSLETPMACGIGICFTCVAKVRDDQGGWDYKRTCVEGPIFDAERIEW